MSLDHAPQLSRTLAQRRYAHSVAFLQARDTNFDKMLGVVAREVAGLQHMLLTSSAVHGLANATSDIDTICVVDGDDLTARTATQFFDGGNHFETILFSKNEVARELQRLEQAAAGSAAQTFAAYMAWNKNGPMNRKYLERLVNGVTSDGKSPYLEHVTALGPVWRAASLGQAIMSVGCMNLAVTAGRGQAALGYAVNAILFAMDAVMSHHGQVYSNKKWYRLRFARFVAEDSCVPACRPFVAQLVTHWDDAVLALRDGHVPDQMFAGIFDTVAGLDVAMGTAMQQGAAWAQAEGACTKRFLPQAFAQVLAPGTVQVLGAAPHSVRIGDEHALTEKEAHTALQAIRGGAMSITFADRGE